MTQPILLEDSTRISSIRGCLFQFDFRISEAITKHRHFSLKLFKRIVAPQLDIHYNSRYLPVFAVSGRWLLHSARQPHLGQSIRLSELIEH